MFTLGLVLDRSFERMDGRGRHEASAHRPRMNTESLIETSRFSLSSAGNVC